MKIINCGTGIHAREITGISLLAGLPSHWFAYTNLDLAIATGASREIDVIIVAEDRILVVDLKDWKGPIESREGRWYNNGHDHGPSPVKKIAQNSRDIFIQLEAHLKKHLKGKPYKIPKVQGLVVLTQTGDLAGIAESEVKSVMPVAAFTATLKSVPARIATFGAAPPDVPLTDPEWKAQLSKFFNVSKGVFTPGRRMYGGFYASSPQPVFKHPNGVYAEFEASDERQSPTLGVLRLWDFTMAETRFQTESGRGEIAGREQEVIAYLQDRSDDCENVIVDGRVRDPEYSVQYWEVYDRRRRLHRLLDFAGTELNELGRADRIELARQLITAVNSLHLAEATHLDLGQHSIWLQRPSTVKLSHLMAASYPDIRSLGESRFQFLSTGRLPEDVFGDEGSPKRRDVFLTAAAAHRILFGTGPKATDGCPEWSSSADVATDFIELHEWFEKALAWDPQLRHGDAGEALAAFNAATAVRPTPAEVVEGLQRHTDAIKSQYQLFTAYPPEGGMLRDDEAGMRWRSRCGDGDVMIKVWKRATWGDQQREGPKILAFLDRTSELASVQPEGCPTVLQGIWLGDAIVLVQQWVDLPNLEAVLADGGLDDVNARLTLVGALADRVEKLHALRIAHGDLKPANILVDPSAPNNPMVVDLVDFTAAADGEIANKRYAPESGGRYERDRFAITAIAEELLSSDDSIASLRVRDAIQEIRKADAPNATLLPILDALRAPDSNASNMERIVLRTLEVDSGPVLADEGRYYLRKSPWGRGIIIRGACEEVEVKLGSDNLPVSVLRRAVDQSRIRFVTRFEFGHFEGTIFFEAAPAVDFAQLAAVLKREEVVAALSPRSAVPSEADAQEERTAERESTPGEPPEDDLIEAIAAAPVPTGQVDVGRLWQSLIDAEEELVTYGQVAEDSGFDTSTTRHKAHFDLLSGSFDYNRNDSVMVEREDRHGNWRPIGHLDLQRSKPDFIFIESFRPHPRGAPPLVEQGEELRFRSRMEQKSLDRRQAAVKRVVGKASRTRDLIHVIDPRSDAKPRMLLNRLAPELLKENYGLNDKQAAALSAVLATRPLALVQGPPGTGKTVFIAALVHAALTHGLARNVLLSSQAHEAVNNAAEAVLKLFAKAGDAPSILRVGNEGVVSDRLLPFHVERVEKLQKDRFRAELRERLGVAANALGIPAELADKLAHVEHAIRPVAIRISELDGDTANAQRVAALRETICQQLLPLQVDASVGSAMQADQIIGDIVSACIMQMPPDERPSLDRVARYQSVAAIARDFIGSVSTEHRSFETFLAGTRQIVAGTCVGLGRSSLGLTSTPFDLVIVDEAARCTASELAVPAQAGSWIVLVGDQEQLQPQHPESVVEKVAKQLHVSEAEVARSDFERVFESAYGREAGHTLRRQYRMLPAIGEIVSRSFYERKLEHGRHKPIIDPAILPLELSSPVVWIDTAPVGERGRQGDPNHRKSLSNTVEADAIVALLKRLGDSEEFVIWLSAQTAHAHAIGVICAYSAQRDLVRRKLALSSVHQTVREALKVDTIDSYQGKENPIVIVSLVRNNWLGTRANGSAVIRPGFLAKPNRINVAMSRAMDRLVIVGSRSRWAAGGPMDKIAQAFAQCVEAGDGRVIDANALLNPSPVAATAAQPMDLPAESCK
ncbi:AAA domain-containing protein [Caulobacter sp. DWR1-3-2b1]|uniref:AAA domain-containing protein n=1 Tax=Caulobacter sp. DWR1-3-2b1 TaxID=2804670 RepID=UPI003CF8B33F